MKIELNEVQKNMILKHVNVEGKLPCAMALSLAKKLNIDSTDMFRVTNNLGVKIGQCELGLFGNKESIIMDDTQVYEEISSYSTDKTIECKKLWEVAKKFTMKEVRSTLKQSDINVTYCQLGCFEEGKKNGSKS